MSRTITTMFDSRSDAESARDRLSASSIDADRVRIIDQSSAGTDTDSTASQNSTGEGHGFWASLKDMFMPDEDRQAYGEGIRRGGFMLVADVDESDADRACSILDESNGVDFDKRQDEWRTEGWTGADGQAGAFGRLSGNDDTRAPDDTGHGVRDAINSGKREIERGGAKVRSYVRDKMDDDRTGDRSAFGGFDRDEPTTRTDAERTTADRNRDLP